MDKTTAAVLVSKLLPGIHNFLPFFAFIYEKWCDFYIMFKAAVLGICLLFDKMFLNLSLSLCLAQIYQSASPLSFCKAITHPHSYNHFYHSIFFFQLCISAMIVCIYAADMKISKMKLLRDLSSTDNSIRLKRSLTNQMLEQQQVCVFVADIPPSEYSLFINIKSMGAVHNIC